MSKDKGNIPDGYFADFGKRLDKNIVNLEDDLSSCTELLKIGKEEPYKLPAGYFNNFSNRLRSRLTPVKSRRLLPYLGLAACISLLIGFAVFTFQPQQAEPANPNGLVEIHSTTDQFNFLNQADEEQVDEFLEDVLSEIDDNELAEILESVI